MEIPFGKFRMHVERSVATNGYSIWFVVDTPDGLCHVAEPVEFKFKENKKGAFINPTIELGMEMAGILLKSLAEGGVKIEDVSKMEGLLEAKDAHLEDMRKLVFDASLHLNHVQ